MQEMWVFEENVGYSIDTGELAKKAIQVAATRNIPPSYGLGALYQYVTGTNLELAHQAMDDVNGTVSILQHMSFWNVWKSCLFGFQTIPTIQANSLQYDSDLGRANNIGTSK